MEPRGDAAAAGRPADGDPRRPALAGRQRRAVAAGPGPDPARPRAGPHPGARRRLGRARSSPRGSAARSSTGSSSRCSAASTPATPTSCRWTRRCRSWPARSGSSARCCERSRRCSDPGRPAAAVSVAGGAIAGPTPTAGRPAGVRRHQRAGSAGCPPRSPPPACAAARRSGSGATVRELRRSPGRLAPRRSDRPGSPSRCSRDAVVLAVPAAAGVAAAAAVAPEAAAELGRRSSTPASRWSPFAVPLEQVDRAAAGHRLPGAAGRRPRRQGRDVLLAEVGVARRRGRRPGRRCGRRSGRHREVADLQRDDDELAAPALADLSRGLRVDLQPGRPAGHALGRGAAAVRRRAPRPGRADPARGRRAPGLAVCGAAYDGVGDPGVRRRRRGPRPTGCSRASAARRQWGHG